MALDELLGQYTCMALKVVYVLGEVCEEFSFVLEQSDESVGWRVLVGGR